MTADYKEYWSKYFTRKVAKHKYQKDNRPFTKREKRLMKAAFASGFDWYNYKGKFDKENLKRSS